MRFYDKKKATYLYPTPIKKTRGLPFSKNKVSSIWLSFMRTLSRRAKPIS